jgi:hypothetical protein
MLLVRGGSSVVRRRGSAAGTARSGARRQAVNVTSLRNTADGLLSRLEDLVVEIESLRADIARVQQENQQLRTELSEGVDMLRGAEAILAGKTASVQRPRRGRPEQPTATPGPRRVRTTPASVTPDVVRSVIQRLGSATAAQIAEDIGRGGTPVSGRAIRHIAKAAGAVARPGDGGMVYSLG